MMHRWIRRAAPPVVGLAVLSGLLVAGCASSSAARVGGNQGAVEQNEAERKQARALYAGKPAIVHATEFPVASAAEAIGEGDKAVAGGRIDLAIYRYVQALEFNPRDATTLLKIGLLHEGRGNKPLAQQAYEMALQRDDRLDEARERLGLIYVDENRDKDADYLLREAVRRQPDRWRAHNALGILADRARDSAAAVAHYDDALRARPDAAMVWSNRGASHAMAGDDASAEADFLHALSIEKLERTWLQLGRLRYRRHDKDGALAALLEALPIPQAYNAMGEEAMKQAQYDVAANYFERATIASASYYPDASTNLALARQKLATLQSNRDTKNAASRVPAVR